MNTKLYVLLAAGVLALSACKNETPAAQDAAADAAAATDQAAAAAGDDQHFTFKFFHLALPP